MLVSFNEKSTPTWTVRLILSPKTNLNNISFLKIPMPAVTICPESKTDVEKFNLTNILDMVEANETLTPKDLMYLQALSQICDFEVGDTVSAVIGNKLENVNISNVNIPRSLFEISNDFHNSSFMSFSTEKLWPMKSVCREIVTSEGVCYVFNMLDRRDLYSEELTDTLRFPINSRLERSNWTVFGYPDDKDENAFPYRIIGSGRKAGISIVLRMRRKNIDYACKDTAEGFRLTLHNPDELPLPTAMFHKIPIDAETLVVLQPRVMSTSDNMRHYKPVKRQCYFPGEKRLKFFKSYTQSSCKLECLAGEWVCVHIEKSFDYLIESNRAAHFLKICNCVKFHMPHQKGSRICNQKDVRCIKQTEYRIIMFVSWAFILFFNVCTFFLGNDWRNVQKR